MRFSKQLNQTDCGPCALGNAIKFMGYGRGYRKNHCYYKAALGWLPNTGVSCSEMSRTLKFLAKPFGFKQSRMLKPTWNKMMLALDNGYGLIVAYNFKPCDIVTGHFVFLSKEGENYIVWNDTIKDIYTSPLTHSKVNPNKINVRLSRGGCVWKVCNERV